MTPAFEKISDAIPSRPDNSGEGRVAPQSCASHDTLLWRQLSAAGLVAVAEKIVAGRDLDLEEALALSHVSLPLLGKFVQLRPAVCDTCDTVAALPIKRVSSLPKSPRCIGQAQADWESFCRTLIAVRGEIPSTGVAPFWHPIVGQPLDRGLGCDGGYTGVEILRAIALARLILPAAIQVRAPLATLGPKLAQVALDFGASHLGYVAADGQTPNDPLVADSAMFDELLGSCLPTSLKDEA